MYLKNIELSNFRNYENLNIEFVNGTNIIYGNNGKGKTNILEAIYVSAITKSYRAQKDMEYINFNFESTRINSCFSKENIDFNVEVFADKTGNKCIKEDGLKINKYTEFIGKFPIVLFCPEDMDIVKGAPKNRRKFLDILISQISKKYVIILSEYKKTINMKNSLLKLDKGKIDLNYLKIINEKLAGQILEIVSRRKEYIEKLLIYAKEIQKKISKESEELDLIYITEFKDMNYEQILDTLNNSMDSDIFKKTSTKGVGHDDFLVLVNGNEVSKYGSQGQNRTAMLALKIGEAKLLEKEKETLPIVLLDDVFSELDNERINFLLEYIKRFQTVITTTTIENIRIDDAKIFAINELAK